MNFKTKHPHYEYLRKKWAGKQKELSDKLISSHNSAIRHATLGGIGGLMLLGAGGAMPYLPDHQVMAENMQNKEGITKTEDQNRLLAEALKNKVPSDMRALTDDEEKQMADLLTEKFEMPIKPEIGGIRLNRSYGVIGGEQHLYRYPGDNVNLHAENAADWAMYGPSGIAPGLGAWGYFAPSQAQFTEKEKQQERYYLAVQTFLAPGFAENFATYRDFFKFRKMLVVNPKTGQAVVAVIGDAGPAEWTGKHLGGSPEAMHYLGLAGGPRKGPVLYFFIDDPNDKIPLGPISPKGVNSI